VSLAIAIRASGQPFSRSSERTDVWPPAFIESQIPCRDAPRPVGQNAAIRRAPLAPVRQKKLSESSRPKRRETLEDNKPRSAKWLCELGLPPRSIRAARLRLPTRFGRTSPQAYADIDLA
jgi:hypothetical protein